MNSAGFVQLFALSDSFTKFSTEPETIKPPQLLPTLAPVLNVLAKLCESDAKVTQALERQVETISSKPEMVNHPPNQDEAKKAQVKKPSTPI